MRITFIVIVSVLLVSFVSDKHFNYLPKTNGVVVHHSNYSLEYSEACEQAKWVAYQLTKEEVQGIYTRTNDFREDTSISTHSSQLSDYKYSGYDRGHLAPAGDMRFSKTAMSESFLLSNISPQKAEFNRGIWKQLEELEPGQLSMIVFML